MNKATMRAKGIYVMPVYRYYTVKNPKNLLGMKPEDLYDEDMIRYEDEEIFDDQGNYLETKRNTIVTMREVERFIFIKKKRPVDQRGRLFPKCSDDKKEEIKNEQ